MVKLELLPWGCMCYTFTNEATLGTRALSVACILQLTQHVLTATSALLVSATNVSYTAILYSITH